MEMENICFTCERSEVWPASIEGPEEVVCKQRLYPDDKRCLRHKEYMAMYEEDEDE